MSEVYLGDPPSLDRCGWLEEINLPFPLRKLSSNLPHYVTLLSSISSNHFQKVTFTVGLDPFLVNSGSIKRALLDKGWQAFKDALLRLSSRSLNRLEVSWSPGCAVYEWSETKSRSYRDLEMRAASDFNFGHQKMPLND